MTENATENVTRRVQAKLGSGLDPKSEPSDILAGNDLSGKVAVVTGGYSGIGLETTRALARAGAKVYVPVRNFDKAAETLGTIEIGEVIPLPMDLGDFASVRRFVDEMLESEEQIDLLSNNAGIRACPQAQIEGGWESQFGINHLGHFILTKGLLPALLAADAPRVVCLSSIGHRRGGVNFDDINFEQTPYEKWTAYAQAKTANALFALGLDMKYADKGLRAFSVHPGGIMTPLQRHLDNQEMVALGWIDENGIFQSSPPRFLNLRRRGVRQRCGRLQARCCKVRADCIAKTAMSLTWLMRRRLVTLVLRSGRLILSWQTSCGN